MAAKLGVPDEDREAFAELYHAFAERLGKAPPEQQLREWRTALAESPAPAQVRAFMDCGDVASKLEALAGRHGDAAARALESLKARLMFTCVYGKTKDDAPLHFADALAKVLNDGEAQLGGRSAIATAQRLAYRPGTYRQSHAAIRAAAYPYTPACATGPGAMTIDCVVEGSDELLGYIAFHRSGYVDDVSILPMHHGRGIAKALVRAAAQHLDDAGIRELSLHVRAVNHPAIMLYKSLGLEFGPNEYPPWYTWHGGYHLHGRSKEIATRGNASKDA